MAWRGGRAGAAVLRGEVPPETSGVLEPLGNWREILMKLRTLIAALFVGALSMQWPAAAAPARTNSVTALEPTAVWAGMKTSGANTSFLTSLAKPAACSTNPETYCDDTLVKLDVLNTDAQTRLKFRIADFGKPTDDFDLRVYRSDASGTVGAYLGSPVGDVASTSPLGSDDPRYTGPGDFETKIVSGVAPGDYYLIRVVYFAVADSTYKGSVTIEGLPPQPEPTPTPTP